MKQQNFTALTKKYSIALVSAITCLLLGNDALSQTAPATQTLPYSQDFSALPAASTTYPLGWQGWILASASSASFRLTAPTANALLIASSGASTATGGVHNYNGKIGILASGSTDPSLCLAINTTGAADVRISFDAMTIRNPYDGISNTRLNGFDLQYRIGVISTGWLSVSGLASGIYQNNTALQTGTGVTTPQNPQAVVLTLPAACNNQPVVYLRWAQRDISGAGSRPSFAVDNITICAPPVLNTCPSDIVLCNSNIATWLDPVATGAPAPTIVCTPPSGSIFPPGTTVVTCTATNSCGIGSASCTFNVTVNSIVCQNGGTVNPGCGCDCPAGYSGQFCEIFNCVPPVIGPCPANIVQCDNNVVTWPTPTATGTPVPTVTCTPPSGSAFPNGTSQVTCTATNSCGTSICTFDVTINATPVISCPGNITVNNTAGQCGANVSFNATASGTPTPSINYSPASGSFFPTGTTTVTATASNSCGSASCTFTVTVNDNETPTAVCQNINVPLSAAGTATITAAQVNNGSFDNCGTINLVSVSPSSFNCSNVGVATATDLIISEYVEGSGNNKYLEIFNGTSTVKNLANYELRLYANGSPTATTTNNLGAAGSLSPGAKVVLRNSLAVLYGGSTFVFSAVNWNGDDAIALYNTLSGQNADIFGRIGDDPGASWSLGGNTTVDKTLRRKATVANGITINPTGTGPSAFATLFSEWDQFNVDIVSGLGAHTYSPAAATTPVVLSINDGNGNTSTCTANITVQDVTPPTVVCQGITLPLDPTGTATITASQIDNGSSDACGIANMTVSPSAFTCANMGPNPVTLTVTDVNGLVSSCIAIVTVVDNSPPTASCQNIAISLDATGNASITPAQVNNGSTDNCGTVNLVSVVPNTFNCTNVNSLPAPSIWINEIHYDNSGSDAGEFIELAGSSGINLANYALVRYNGATPGAAVIYSSPAQTTALTGTMPNQSNGYGTFAVFYAADGLQNGTSDGVALVNTATSTVVQLLSYEGSFTVAAGQGLASGMTSTNLPVSESGGITGGSIRLAGFGNVYSSFTWQTEAASASPGAINAGQSFPVLPGNVVTLTINDGNGNTSTCTANVTVLDVTPPSLTCPSAQNLNVTAGCVASLPNYTGLATASDACGAPVITQSPVAGTSVGVGTTVVTLTATDASGLTATCSFNVAVSDNTPPVANCQNLTIQLNGAGAASVTAAQINNGSTDNCGILSTSVSPSSFTCADIAGDPASDLIISEYVEGSGNNKYIELYNGTASTINLSNYQLRNYSNGATSPNFTNVLSGTLTPGTTVVFRNSLATIYGGSATVLTSVVFNGDDAMVLWKISSNSAVDIFGRIGEDPGTAWSLGGNTTLDKTLRRKSTVTQGVTVNPATGFPSLFTEWDQLNVDDVSGLGSHSLNAGNLVTLTVTDIYSNVSTCTAYITVQDLIQPVVNCPFSGTITRNTDAGVCTYTAQAAEFNATSTDNCTVTSLTYQLLGATTGTGTNLANVVFNKGSTIVRWTASDGINATVQCSFVVTVIDNQQPVISCPISGNTNRNTDAGVCTYTVQAAEFNATATDNCTVTTLTYTLTGVTTGTGTSLAGVVFNKGVTTVTWTATDGVTTDVACSFTVTVIDNQQPVINCPVAVNANRNTDAGVCTYAVQATEFNASATDNCLVTSLTYALTGVTTGTGTSLAGVAFNKGVTTVTWTATDGVTTAVVCSFTVTVIDNQQPVISCPISGNTNRNTDAGVCTYTAVLTEFNATATDNCSVTSLTYALTGVTTGTGTSLAGVAFNKGVTTVTWTATDGVTTAIACSFTVTVIDNQQPVISCPVAVNANRNTDAGVCTYTVQATEFNSTATDNCSVTSLTYALTGVTTGTGTSLAGVVFNKGVTTVTWTATDGVTTAVACSFTVTVIDNQQPVISCPISGNTIRNTDAGVCTYSAVLTEFNATATDNCLVTSLTYALTGVTTGTGTSLAGVVFNKGVTTVTWTATDGVTTDVACSFTVTVLDNQFPVFTTPCPASFAACNAPGISWTPPVASDNCSVVLISNFSPGHYFTPGTTTTVIYSAEDPSGNITTCSFDVTAKTESTDPTSASASQTIICAGDQVSLSVTGGSLGTGAVWKWYAGSCGGTLVGVGATVNVITNVTTTYFVRAEGDCNTTSCVSTTVTVRTLSTDPASASSNAPVNGICIGGNVTLTVAGGSLGTSAGWVWYEDGCGNGSPIGTGASITITPAFEGLHSYYVRAEGPCNTTNCAAVSVLVGTYSVEASGITTSAPGNSICSGNAITMTLNGGFLGTVGVWNWYSGSCGGTLVGTGTSITVTPSATTTYFVRAEGSCNTTSCASVTVYRSTTPPGNPPPTITTAPNGICSGNASTLVCQTVSGATYYSWSGPNGTTFGPNNSPAPYITTVPTTTVTFGNLPNGVSGYDICVFAANGCGTSVTKCRYIRGRVQSAQTITGNASSCPNTSSVYSITSLPGADNYTWTVTGDADINGGGTTLTTTSTSITVNFLAGWTSGTLSVYGSMSCGYSAPAKTITIISTPVVPGIMSGPVLVCPLGTYTYSISPVAGATGYNWSTNVPGATMTGTGTSRNITFPSVIPAGSTVSVTASGSCGTSTPRILNIATGIANAPGFITGPTIGQCGQVGVSYSILPASGATSYTWSANNGAVASSPNGLTSITFDFPSNFVTSTVSVVSVNSCGNSIPQTTVVTGAAGQPGLITGNQAVCNGAIETYSTTGASGATSYFWVVPAGASIISGQNQASIQVLWGATSGNVSVYSQNSCGNSITRLLPVSVVCRFAQLGGSTLTNATLYPNPTFGNTTLKFEAATAGNYRVSVVDVTGRILSVESVDAAEGINMHELNLATYAKGLYMVRMELSGEPAQTLKVTLE